MKLEKTINKRILVLFQKLCKIHYSFMKTVNKDIGQSITKSQMEKTIRMTNIELPVTCIILQEACMKSHIRRRIKP